MAGGVHFFATASDEDVLLDFLDEPASVRLFQWWGEPDTYLARNARQGHGGIGIHAIHQGPLQWVRINDTTTHPDGRSSLLRRVNWSNDPRHALLDVDASPALLWSRGSTAGPTITPSALGHQAASLREMTDEFRRWESRVIRWVNRTGTVVWNCADPRNPQPTGDVQLLTVSTVYALPGAAAAIREGASGRSHL